MEEKWRIVRNDDGSIVVVGSRDIVLLRADGVTGFGFAREYLRQTEKHYRAHLMAVDLLLQRMMGKGYQSVRRVMPVYQSYMAMTSLCCRFSDGCAIRQVCPFNGFHPTEREKRIVGCNPVYELPMTDGQLRVADLLANSAYSLSAIAETLCLSESRVRSVASAVYAAMGVEGRQELTVFLRGKRIL